MGEPIRINDRRVGAHAAPAPPRRYIPGTGISVEAPPPSLDDIVGQVELIDRLRVIIAGCKARDAKVPHVLLSGPAGYGKSSVARIIASELRVPLVTVSGPTIQKTDRLVKVLARLEHEVVLFIDEIHRLPMAVEEVLYEAMQEGTLSYVSGGQAITRTLPTLHVVGATTLPGNLSAPLRDRFGFAGRMADYSPDDLTTIVSRAWDRAGFQHTEGAARVIALRGKGVPRVALHLGDRAADYAACNGVDPTRGTLDEAVALAAMERFGIIEGGLTETDLKVLQALTKAGVPMGLDNLAQLIEVDVRSLTTELEPPLVRAGLLARTPSGRVATQDAYELVASLAA